MFILNQLQFTQKKTTYSSIKNCYGIGNKTSKKLNSILLNKPNAKEFKYDLNKLIRSKEGKNIFSLPSELTLRSNEYSKLQHLTEIKTYRAFRHFQNLPSKGQRTHTNGQTSKKQKCPMLRLKLNKDITENYIVKFKKMEFLKNGRSEEYNALVKTQINKRTQGKKKYNKKASEEKKKKKKNILAKKKKK